MSLLVLESAGLSFAGRVLFSDLGLRVDAGDRIGIVGRNGSGKTSLLKICAGKLEPGDGTVRYAGGMRIGYLPQEIDVEGGIPLVDSVVNSVPGKRALEDDLVAVEIGLEQSTIEAEQMELSTRLVELHEALNAFESTFSRHEALSILAGLGFTETDYSRDLSEFSGGWQMRAVLAALLFQKPDLLLLDEPTNHLDVPSVTWLGSFLKRQKQAVMLICHDREFLNEQVSRVVAFEADGVRQFAGNYDAYLRARVEHIEILGRRAANLAREKEQAERFIRRFRAQASKARAVQSRIKQLEKIEDVSVPTDERSLNFVFPPCERAGQDAVTLKDLSHDYGAGPVIGGVSLLARRGDRIAVVGANGNGKSTLLRIIAERQTPTGGEAKVGHNVKVAYYAQHVTELLDTRSSVLEEVWRHSAVEDITSVRNALGTMMFSGDDVDKSIGVLSGGEKARVALARIMVNPGNLLVMDEPTNHLDLESSEALATALRTFGGTIVFASHNRSFVNALATRIWDVKDGGVEEFPGTFAEYMDHCSRVSSGQVDETLQPEPAKKGKKSKSSRPTETETPSKKEPKPRSRPRNLRGLRDRVSKYETRIAELEERQAERSTELSRPETYNDQARYNELLVAFQKDAEKLEELMARWEHAERELAEAN